jgi:hypothetical protein
MLHFDDELTDILEILSTTLNTAENHRWASRAVSANAFSLHL